MKIKLILLILSIFLFNCNSKEKKQNISQIYLYEDSGANLDDGLDPKKFIKIDGIEDFKKLYKSREEHKGTFLWKGYYLVKVEYENSDKPSYYKLSYYARRIYSFDNKKLYKIPKFTKNIWDNFINNMIMTKKQYRP